ncbi:tetratricopeptide repeat protein 19, mitochondrial [Caerostris darwini]|uniref:Tetratricopeptide repeat protein 19, mitochondrial n=1 Tax=Caerostris darwini TaxID=1538125 RepID=A0AAV4PBG2_9ARAC|nr:tetratricopeptide repeat protein 19, mitochondrial [Caerostris darwini]
MRNSFWRVLSTCIFKYRTCNSYCKCIQCKETYLKYKRKDASVFSIKLTDSGSKSFSSKHKSFLLAGILTWLGLKKEEKEEDPMISVIKLGILNMQKKEYNTAENILHLALKLAQERQDMEAQRYIFDLLANVAFEKGDFPKAEKLFIQVTKELLATGTAFDDNSIVEISLKLASIYSQREEKEKAEKGFQFCISTQQSKLDSIDLSKVDALSDNQKDTVLLWAMCVDWYARYLLASGMLKDAKENFQKALDISERINGISHPQTLVLLNDIGSVHSLLNETDLAVENFKKAIKRSSESESPDLPAFYCNLGATYLQTGNISRGEEACRTALRLARKMKHTVAEADATECLKELKDLKNQ